MNSMLRQAFHANLQPDPSPLLVNVSKLTMQEDRGKTAPHVLLNDMLKLFNFFRNTEKQGVEILQKLNFRSLQCTNI